MTKWIDSHLTLVSVLFLLMLGIVLISVPTLHDYQTVIAIVIAVAGWIMSHRLSIRAQNKAFINQVTNTARQEIIRALNDYSSWLSQLNGFLQASPITVKITPITPENLKFSSDSFAEIEKTLPMEWNSLLEEYQILFPEVEHVRSALSERDRKIMSFKLWFRTTYWADDVQYLVASRIDEMLKQKLLVLEEASHSLDFLLNQMVLIQDLKFYIQNRCLSNFTGHAIPERRPLKDGYPIIKPENGKLVLLYDNDYIRPL